MAHEAYLTYEEYKQLGGTLVESDFTLAEFKARKRIDSLTLSRVQHMQSVPQAVKLCCMALITVENKAGFEAQAITPTVASFNTDGYSQTFSHISAEETSAGLNGIVRQYLYGETDDNGTPLLYRGWG